MDGAGNGLVLFVLLRCVYTKLSDVLFEAILIRKYLWMVIRTIARSITRYISAINAFALLTTSSNVACNIPTKYFVFPLPTPMVKELIQII